ncbi:hypothetical protein [Melghirimyces algeriensis]|uniref:Uncharacterized protein n=1 Tax=Melghirimyces algeriensis TaxID=910412 RepID=A0A521FBI3_9BACL|nr:hypothetical protein [Melghirimyces algeriensis]SMO92900.1 hypothetical protein SAMN06264849_1159 [Melghirimyces algeriensis]
MTTVDTVISGMVAGSIITALFLLPTGFALGVLWTQLTSRRII